MEKKTDWKIGDNVWFKNRFAHKKGQLFTHGVIVNTFKISKAGGKDRHYADVQCDGEKVPVVKHFDILFESKDAIIQNDIDVENAQANKIKNKDDLIRFILAAYIDYEDEIENRDRDIIAQKMAEFGIEK